VPSRVKKVRSAAPARSRVRPAAPGARSARQARPASPPPADRFARAAPAAPPAALAASPSHAAGTTADRPPRGLTMSRRALKNWRVRSRLLLLIIIPTLTAVVLGGTYIVTSVQNALVDQRVETLANLSFDVTSLAAHLEDERDQTMEYIGDGDGSGRLGTLQHNTTNGAPQNLALVQQEQVLTAPWVRKVQTDSAAVGSGYPPQVQQEAANIGDVLQLLGPLRNAATTTNLPAVVVMQDYTNMIDDLLSIDNNIAGDSGDSVLTGDVRALNLISLVDEEASEQRGLLAYAFAVDGPFQPAVLAGVQTAQAEQQANVAEFERVATAQQVALYQNRVQGSLVDFASNYEQQAITFGENGVPLSTTATTANEWYGAMSTGTIGGIRAVEQDLVTATVGRATALHRDAIIKASLIGGAVLVVLLLALLLTAVVGRTMVRPLRRLRSGALEVAGVRLPETVRRMSESDGASVPLDIEPIDVDSFDEIGEVARAFDQVHREALRLAANEAALRGNVNAMFVNLSRRSQSLVERQIRLIDDLEQGEQDPDRLSSLFQMDHLATRMRRNSENLLVLAGHEATRRWNQPVALVDVLRAAVSEIEQYERVKLNVQPGIAVRGHAVNDVVHLLAELAENATSFSSAETPVAVAGHLLSSGGVLLDITDQGVGMGAEEMAHANWRLDNPPVVDVAVSRRMGLFVVARLAARHGIRVRLRPAPAGGLTALVWLPDEVISHQSDVSPPGTRRFEPGTGALAGMSTVAALAAGRNGDGELSPAEQEINAARMPRFSALQPDSLPSASGELVGESGLGPRRVPGAGPHPGTVGRGGAASTTPLPAFGSPEAEADLAAAAAQAESAGSLPADGDRYAGPTPVAESDRFSAPPTARPRPLGPPSVVGQQGFGAHQSPAGSFGLAGSGPADLGSPSGVVVPTAEHVATENRLPIFEAVESDWFRRGRVGVGAGGGRGGSTALGAGPGSDRWPTLPVPEPEATWRSSAADEGWEAAAAASSPSTGGTTDAGLPKRVPQANLVPGAAPPETVEPVPARSAAATRDRFASFQRGIREGRAAVSREEETPDGDGGSR
jgi:signal transduction histidine kinase